jgi:hypothetical protein
MTSSARSMLAAPRWKIVHFHRAGLEHVHPIRILGYAAEDHGVFLGVERRMKMIARPGRHETRGESQTAFGIEGKYHEWDYPITSSVVDQPDRVAATRAELSTVRTLPYGQSPAAV